MNKRFFYIAAFLTVMVAAIGAFIVAGNIVAHSDPSLKRQVVNVPIEPGDEAASEDLPGPFWGAFSASARHDVPRPFRSVTVKDAQGAPFRLPDDLAGRYTLVNFWALWCAPCIDELPSLDRLRSARDREMFDVILVSLDYPSDMDVHRSRMARVGLDGISTYFAQDQDVWDVFSLEGLPMTLILNGAGEIIYTLAGDADWDSAAAHEAIDDLLEQP